MTAVGRLVRLGRIALDFRLRREVVASMPIRLWIESSSRCNLRCPMCLNKDTPASGKGHMDFGLFRKVIDEAKSFVNDVYLHHRGEPLLNPRFFDMISYARSAGIKTRFHTNGTLLGEEECRKLLDARPNLVSFSVDGFQKEAYERVRVGGAFEATIENIFRLLRMKRERGQDLPYVVIEKIVFGRPDPPEVQAEVERLRRRFLDEGASEVIEKQEYVWTTESAPEPTEARHCAVCTFPWYGAVICWDGTVTPCPQDYAARMNMGNVKNSSLREVWNGPAYRDLRRRLANDVGSLPLCRKCDRIRRRTVAGVPLQYMASFFADQFVGYNRLRRAMKTSERN
jgi:radical SAM protein with 4Fe4S-binding SPASM domain